MELASLGLGGGGMPRNLSQPQDWLVSVQLQSLPATSLFFISILTRPPTTFNKLVITVRVMTVAELFIIHLQEPRHGLRQRFPQRRAVRQCCSTVIVLLLLVVLHVLPRIFLTGLQTISLNKLINQTAFPLLFSLAFILVIPRWFTVKTILEYLAWLFLSSYIMHHGCAQSWLCVRDWKSSSLNWCKWRLGDFIVSALGSGWSGLGSSPDQGHFAVFFGKPILTVPLSAHVFNWMGTGKLDTGG